MPPARSALVVALLAALALPTLALPTPARAADEQLIAFVQPDAAVDQRFVADVWPQIEARARELGTATQLIEITDAAPDVVHITPMVVFQNHRGRAIYQGRFDNLDRIATFVRTSRRIPQTEATFDIENAPVATYGRATIAAPLKITDLTGAVPADYDGDVFRAEVRAGLAAGFDRFRDAARTSLARGDRRFYFDLHPYRSEDGRLFISIEVYSQFHCKDPVFSRMSEPVEGTWDDRASAFAAAARALEDAALAIMNDPSTGDAFTPTPVAVRNASFETMGFTLPEPPATARGEAPLDTTLPNTWTVAVDDVEPAPAMLFRFPAPLDNYAGEAPDITGDVTLADATDLSTAQGRFVVKTATVTLGQKDLDEVVRSSLMLHSRKHPESSFEIESITVNGGSLRFGEATPGVMRGRFVMKNIPITIDVPTVFEPIVNAAGDVRLLLTGSFSIRLKDPFGIDGPDGPEPAKDTLLYDFVLPLAPGGDASAAE